MADGLHLRFLRLVVANKTDLRRCGAWLMSGFRGLMSQRKREKLISSFLEPPNLRMSVFECLKLKRGTPKAGYVGFRGYPLWLNRDPKATPACPRAACRTEVLKGLQLPSPEEEPRHAQHPVLDSVQRKPGRRKKNSGRRARKTPWKRRKTENRSQKNAPQRDAPGFLERNGQPTHKT